MKALVIDYQSLLSSIERPKAGLPFWLFYFLLSLIILLIFFNFLQNKDLRQKLSYILAGPRRRFDRLRLEVTIKKEEQKKAELLRKLGELSSIKWPDLPEIEEIASEIRSLEEKKASLQAQWHGLYRQLETFKLEKRKLLANNNSSGSLKRELVELEKKIATLEKEKTEIQESLLANNELLEPHHETIGRIIYKLRPDREDLSFLYFQIDKANKIIQELKEKMESL
ncbi:MAG: hypothetical protein ACPLRA_05335 [Candidatus Saccharicenans sp.]